MVVESLALVNFRSHAECRVKFCDGTTVIVGANGSGKTSLLEAIYLGLVGTSFRASDREILKYEQEFFRCEIGLGDARKVVVGYDGKKFFEIDGKKYGRLPREYKYPVILFQPSDMNIVFASPGRRREFFDRIITQVDYQYRTALTHYEKALRQRNEVLKGVRPTKEDVFAWDVVLARYGVEILGWRDKYVGWLNDEVGGIYASIAERKDEIKVIYSGDGEINETGYLAELGRSWERDLVTRVTNFGPHRDNFEFFFNNKVAEDVASRGEVRSVVLAIKFIEAEVIERETGKKPVVLLDDVFSELDETRQAALTTNFQDYQIILSSVNAPSGVRANIQL